MAELLRAPPCPAVASGVPKLEGEDVATLRRRHVFVKTVTIATMLWRPFPCMLACLVLLACDPDQIVRGMGQRGDATKVADAYAGGMQSPVPTMSFSEMSTAEPEDAGATPADTEASDVAQGPSVVPGDTFETALRVQVGDQGTTLVDTLSADQVSYFVFRGEAGKFYEITTDRHSFSPDNIITIFDQDGGPVAENDDGSLWPGDAIDARLVVRLADSGNYYVRVQDLATPAWAFEGPFALFYYTFRLREISAQTEGFALAQSGGPTAFAFEQDEPSGYDYITLVGQLDTAEAVFTFAAQRDTALIGHVIAGGTPGNGSSLSTGYVRVAELGQALVAEVNRGTGQEMIHPPVHDGSYQMVIAASAESAGDNPYYSIDIVGVPENPAEQRDVANDQLSGAEALSLVGGFSRRGLLLSRLPVGDVDYYAVELDQGDLVHAICEAESGGSGVRGLRAEFRTSDDAGLEGGVESALDNLATPVVFADAAGTYYLRLSRDSSTSVPAIEPWVRCVVLVNG